MKKKKDIKNLKHISWDDTIKLIPTVGTLEWDLLIMLIKWVILITANGKKKRRQVKIKSKREQSKSSKGMVILLPYTESSSCSLCTVQTTSVVAEEQDSFICTRWSCVALTEYRWALQATEKEIRSMSASSLHFLVTCNFSGAVAGTTHETETSVCHRPLQKRTVKERWSHDQRNDAIHPARLLQPSRTTMQLYTSFLRYCFCHFLHKVNCIKANRPTYLITLFY